MALKIPFLTKVEPLEPGQSLVVQGIAQGDPFAINLTTGSNVQHDPLDDIGLHLSVRPTENKIVTNSYKGGEWQKEEVHKSKIKGGDRVDIRVRALRDQFQVYVNGEPAFQVAFRIPVGILKHVFINGAISMSNFKYGQGTYYSVPYEERLSGVKSGSVIRVSGFMEPKGDHFVINLKHGSDNVFHFNPRFKEKAVVRNKSHGGEWGEEEREGEMPFVKGHVFDVNFICQNDSYRVEVNDQPFCLFRGDPKQIQSIAIDGDVDVHFVKHT